MDTKTFGEELEEQTQCTLPEIIKKLSSITFIFQTYDHKIDLEAHKEELFVLQKTIELLWEELDISYERKGRKPAK